jgi:hypothetical protein
MLNKLEKRLRSGKLETIKLIDLAKIVDVVGIFDTDAIVDSGKRYVIKSVKSETKDSACILELSTIEYPDKEGRLVREFTELSVDGTAIEINETTEDVDIPVTPGMRIIVLDFLTNKDKYVDVVTKMQRLSELQQIFYVAELSRLEIHNGIIERTGGVFD